jgi:hypothetical protein
VSILREVHADGWCVRLDLSGQMLRLDIPDVEDDWHDESSKSTGPVLLPALPFTSDGPISAATLLMKAKQFDDGLCAAVELVAQQGTGRFAGKASLLRSLASTRTTHSPDTDLAAAATIYAACELGGVSVLCPADLGETVRKVVDDFLRDETLSKPLGFYTWNDPLRTIFRQDRFLQQALDARSADALARALEQTPGASDAYEACLRLNARLTNPPATLGLRDAGDDRAFFPASRSHEVQLLERLFADRPIPDGFDLMGELIRRVRSGKINLMPTEQSGWYDHQTWALEPLLVPDRRPEIDRLDLSRGYRRHLEDLFRGTLALTRETHAKQVGGGRGGYAGPRQRPIWVNPGLTL